MARYPVEQWLAEELPPGEMLVATQEQDFPGVEPARFANDLHALARRESARLGREVVVNTTRKGLREDQVGFWFTVTDKPWSRRRRTRKEQGGEATSGQATTGQAGAPPATFTTTGPATIDTPPGLPEPVVLEPALGPTTLFAYGQEQQGQAPSPPGPTPPPAVHAARSLAERAGYQDPATTGPWDYPQPIPAAPPQPEPVRQPVAPDPVYGLPFSEDTGPDDSQTQPSQEQQPPRRSGEPTWA
jgi:hypothetical protein